MTNPFNWEDVGFNMDDDGQIDLDKYIDWLAMRNVYPIPDQTSMFPPDKDYFLKDEEEINNINSSFDDIIYKNPAYTVQELLDLHHLALDEMGEE